MLLVGSGVAEKTSSLVLGLCLPPPTSHHGSREPRPQQQERPGFRDGRSRELVEERIGVGVAHNKPRTRADLFVSHAEPSVADELAREQLLAPRYREHTATPVPPRTMIPGSGSGMPSGGMRSTGPSKVAA